MNPRIRKLLAAVITAITTGIILWLPIIAQTGITARGAE
jgi:energy-converting hydrogenase Eha subunit A